MRAGVLQLIEENGVAKSAGVNFDDIKNHSELEEQFNEIRAANHFKYTALIVGFDIAKPGTGKMTYDMRYRLVCL